MNNWNASEKGIRKVDLVFRIFSCFCVAVSFRFLNYCSNLINRTSSISHEGHLSIDIEIKIKMKGIPRRL